MNTILTGFLDTVEDAEIPIILYLPHNIVECQEDLIKTVRKFPALKIILTHMGLISLPIDGFEKTFSRVSKLVRGKCIITRLLE